MTITERLLGIGYRAGRATPGPWRWADWDKDPTNPRVPEFPYTLQAPPETMRGGPAPMFPDLPNRILTDCMHDVNRHDRAFIAHAREDIPWMLELIWRLKLELTKMQQDRAMHDAKQAEVRKQWG